VELNYKILLTEFVPDYTGRKKSCS